MHWARALRLTQLGWGLALPVLLLAGVGLAAIHATDRSERAAGAAPPARAPVSSAGDGSAAPRGRLERLVDTIGPRTARQSLFLATGVLLMGAALLPSYQKLGRFAYAYYGLVVALLGLIALDPLLDLELVPVRRAARRWIGYGPFAIQPSEFMKLALVVALARYLRFRDSYRTWRGLVPPFLLTMLPMVLILRQPDLGTLLMLLPVLLAMLFVAGARLRHLAAVVLLGAATLPLFYFFGMKEYQRKRIDVLFRQNVQDERWHMSEGYQLRQSKTALGTGGLAGQGYGQGLFVQYDLLPEEHNDFIFAIIGNQWGLAGGLLVIAAYALIVLFGVEVATVTNDPFGRLLAVGVIVMICAQALLNICMTIGLAPITGMPLPFVSAGGSSLWTNFLALGLLVNVAQRRPMLIAHPPFEYRDH
jgi:rod shape determining protein RodA